MKETGNLIEEIKKVEKKVRLIPLSDSIGHAFMRAYFGQESEENKAIFGKKGERYTFLFSGIVNGSCFVLFKPLFKDIHKEAIFMAGKNGVLKRVKVESVLRSGCDTSYTLYLKTNIGYFTFETPFGDSPRIGRFYPLK